MYRTYMKFTVLALTLQPCIYVLIVKPTELALTLQPCIYVLTLKPRELALMLQPCIYVLILKPTELALTWQPCIHVHVLTLKPMDLALILQPCVHVLSTLKITELALVCYSPINTYRYIANWISLSYMWHWCTYIEAHWASSDITVLPSDNGAVMYMVCRNQRVVQKILQLVHLNSVL